MPRVVGIDPGTVSFDILGLQDGRVFLEHSVPSAEVARRPEALVEVLQAALPLDLIAGPSGYGLPLVPIAAVGEVELRLLYLAQSGEPAGVGGLRTLVRLLRDARLPVVFTPGVIHLATVPVHRKVNRIDLGTADKVCAAAVAVEEQGRRLGIAYGDTSFVLAELGGAFTAVLSVVGGEIVGGQGGSSGPLGYRAGGAMDGEVACLLGTVTKATVFSGGAAFVAGSSDATPDALSTQPDGARRVALDAFCEGVVKAVAGELAASPGAAEILLSGRLARVPGFHDPLASALGRLRPVRRLGLDGKAKEAARGAAMIADGLCGGAYRELVESMRLKEAHGTVLDHLYMAGADEVRKWAMGAARS